MNLTNAKALPDARDSHLAGMKERERARGVAAKLARKEAAQARKHARRAERRRQKYEAERKAKEKEMATMQQTTIPEAATQEEPKRARRAKGGVPLDPAVCARLTDEIRRIGKGAFCEVLREYDPAASDGGIEASVNTLLRDPNHAWFPRLRGVWMRAHAALKLAAAPAEQQTPATSPVVASNSNDIPSWARALLEQSAQQQAQQQAQMNALIAVIAKGPSGTAAQLPAAHEPETSAEVIDLSDFEERINKWALDEVRRRGGTDITKTENGARKESLFTDVWGELDEAMYRECGVDPGARARRLKGKTRIDVCRDLGLLGHLHRLAFRMFGPGRQAAGAR